MIQNHRFGNAIITFVFLLVLNSAFAQDPFTLAKNLFAQKKYDLALVQLKMAYKKQPDKGLVISDICFGEGAKLLKSGNNDIADQLSNFGLDIIRAKSFPISQNLYNYLEAINKSDSVFRIVSRLIPTSSYNVLISTLMNLNPSDAKIYVGRMYSSDNGHSDDLWLYPLNNAFSSIPLSSYNPKATSILANTSISQIKEITSTAFIRSVREDRMFLSEGLTNDLNFSSIPELKDIFNQLRDKNDLQIAAARESVIKEILVAREKYLVVNLNYIFTKFNIPGYCTANLRDYNVDKQELDIHLSIAYDFAVSRGYNPKGIYIATIRVPLSLDEAQKYFGSSEGFNYNISFSGKPGTKRQSLGILGGGSRWAAPNFFLLEDPEFILTNNDGNSIKFKCLGLKGELWPPNVDTRRWDLNEVGSRTTRILSGINLNRPTTSSTNLEKKNGFSLANETQLLCYTRTYPYEGGSGMGDCYDKILMSISKDTVNALYLSGCDATDISPESYLTGKIIENSVSGKILELEYGMDGKTTGDFYENKFKIEFNTDKSKMTYYSTSIIDQKPTSSVLSLTEAKYTFRYGGLSNLRALPNTNSKVLSKIDLSKETVKLIAIGRMQKIGKTTNFWYKIKINNLEGWIFGGLTLNRDLT